MRLGLAGAGVGALVVLGLGAARVAIHQRAQRVPQALAANDARLVASTPAWQPVEPVQPGNFSECAGPRVARDSVSSECASEAARGERAVPTSCRALMEDGNRWVEEWLRCVQRQSRGPQRFGYVAGGIATAHTAGQWLSLHLRPLPVRQALDECALAVVHARDQLWTFGSNACADANALLEPLVGPCRDALGEAPEDVRAAFTSKVDDVASQLPPNGWLGTTLEDRILGDTFDARAAAPRAGLDLLKDELELPRTLHAWDELNARQAPGAGHFDNAGGPMVFDAMVACDQLRDVLKALPASPQSGVVR